MWRTLPCPTLSLFLLVAYPAAVPCRKVEHTIRGKHDPHVLLRLLVGQDLGGDRAHPGIDWKVIFRVQFHVRVHRCWVRWFENDRVSTSDNSSFTPWSVQG